MADQDEADLRARIQREKTPFNVRDLQFVFALLDQTRRELAEEQDSRRVIMRAQAERLGVVEKEIGLWRVQTEAARRKLMDDMLQITRQLGIERQRADAAEDYCRRAVEVIDVIRPLAEALPKTHTARLAIEAFYHQLKEEGHG